MDDKLKAELNKALAASFARDKRMIPHKKPGPKGPRKHIAAPDELEQRRMMDQNRAVWVVLTMRHFRNDVSYGPGKLLLPRGLANELQAAEERSRKVDEQFNGTKAAVIGPRVDRRAHLIISIPYEQMSSDSLDFIRDAPNAVTTK